MTTIDSSGFAVDLGIQIITILTISLSHLQESTKQNKTREKNQNNGIHNIQLFQ